MTCDCDLLAGGEKATRKKEATAKQRDRNRCKCNGNAAQRDSQQLRNGTATFPNRRANGLRTNVCRSDVAAKFSARDSLRQNGSDFGAVPSPRHPVLGECSHKTLPKNRSVCGCESPQIAPVIRNRCSSRLDRRQAFPERGHRPLPTEFILLALDLANSKSDSERPDILEPAGTIYDFLYETRS